ncbi:hypothetical protein P152DRAFT_176706 [Eremomyces bilateralis CBS 781.70]|uniref:Extracellular membrane protein CFEM domain-containing protein n=1 Tax=Eremomyces bilateralis CBS 781.70 TaxID=1392243 RepID=A0A6G1FTC7_9PEZI|nr:uncharacterized protein P152DRAFT_176706 [Eremomyces bilateralis CBS 781.70]KAF1808929.1 hypothetical protein P152DRAFT_176706 [Eremomyces bilateralis CBS 781.70]
MVSPKPWNFAMSSFPSLVMLLGASIAVVDAVPWVGPYPTAKAQFEDMVARGTSPRPTGGVEELFGLMKRGPEQTCGYEFGAPDRPWYCRSTAVCATDTTFYAFGCCNLLSLANDDCTLATTCVPSALAAACTGSCLHDVGATTCSSATAPYCNLYWMTMNGRLFSNYQCESANSLAVDVYTTASTTSTNPLARPTVPSIPRPSVPDAPRPTTPSTYPSPPPLQPP